MHNLCIVGIIIHDQGINSCQTGIGSFGPLNLLTFGHLDLISEVPWHFIFHPLLWQLFTGFLPIDRRSTSTFSCCKLWDRQFFLRDGGIDAKIVRDFRVIRDWGVKLSGMAGFGPPRTAPRWGGGWEHPGKTGVYVAGGLPHKAEGMTHIAKYPVDKKKRKKKYIEKKQKNEKIYSEIMPRKYFIGTKSCGN